MANDFSGLFLTGFKCKVLKLKHNKRLKRDCQRVAFPVPMSRGGFGCCV
ncbi:Death on curing protein, Doc toxin [Vibrio cholerae]|nr:Death on curing protein, Doc toxin [Vibrio cholerae]